MQPTGSKSRMLVKPLHVAFGGSFADIRGCFQAPPRGGHAPQAFAAVLPKSGESISIYVGEVHQLIGACVWQGIAAGACRGASNKRAHSLM